MKWRVVWVRPDDDIECFGANITMVALSGTCKGEGIREERTLTVRFKNDWGRIVTG